MAQLDSAPDSDSGGWRFESAWMHHSKPLALRKGFIVQSMRTLTFR